MDKIILPRLITNAFVKANPHLIFVFGHDYMGKGCFGQASIFGYENTIRIPVMYKFCASGAHYFIDSDGAVKDIISEAIAKIPDDGRPVIILRKIGEGCSRMKELAPNYFAGMKEALNYRQYENLEWDYTT